MQACCPHEAGQAWEERHSREHRADESADELRRGARARDMDQAAGNQRLNAARADPSSAGTIAAMARAAVAAMHNQPAVIHERGVMRIGRTRSPSSAAGMTPQHGVIAGDEPVLRSLVS
jgi:hypothetical protein